MERLGGVSLLFFSILMPAVLCGQTPPPPIAQDRPPATVSSAPEAQSAPAIAPNAPRMSKQTRYEIIRDFETQIVYARTAFPVGSKGLKLQNGVTSPNGEELTKELALWGPALRPGDPAHISYVQIKDDHIHLEINGGPVRRKKWYRRIEISAGPGDTPVNTSPPNENQQNPHGSYLEVYFTKYVPEMSAQQFRDLLAPALDFNSKSKEQAYLETVPPKAKEAILAHRVLVGMDSEMVVHSKGRPPKKVRERDGETEYEEWIYGEPPQDVDFVRLVNEEVVRVETVKVGGEKIVRTDKEILLNRPDKETEAKKNEERPANAPSLRRPGEDPENVPKPTTGANPNQPVPPPSIPQPGDPGPHVFAGPR